MFERISLGILTAIGGLSAVHAWGIGFGNFEAPGPGFLPFWLSFFLAIISGVHFFEVLKKDARESPWPDGSWKRPVQAAALIGGYICALDWGGGFGPATFLLFTGWVGLIEREKKGLVYAVSITGTVSLYVLFNYVLGISLPAGIL